MNTIWKQIFEEYIECYKAIQILSKKGIFDEEEKSVHEHNLLHNLIETMEQEVKR